MKFTLVLLACLTMTLQGCSTIYTVSSDRTAPEELKQDVCRNECSIPRVYSGVALDFCMILKGDGGQGSAIMFWDIFFSLPADTLILPYTAYLQITKGSISSDTICQSSNVTSH